MKNYPLASPFRRLGARCIDTLAVVVVYFFVVNGYRHVLNIPPRYSSSPLWVLNICISTGIFVLINFHFLRTSGQSIGKKLLGLQIKDMNGKIPSLWKSIFLREFLIFVSYNTLRSVAGIYYPALTYYVVLFFIFDDLFIFRPDRRCIHDFLAGTRVVDISVEPVVPKTVIPRKEYTGGGGRNKRVHGPAISEVDAAAFGKELSPTLTTAPAMPMDRFWGYLIDKYVLFQVYLLVLPFVKQIPAYPPEGYVLEDLICRELTFWSLFLVINGLPLVHSGQSIGKLLMGTQILDLDGKVPPLWKIVFFREMIFYWPDILKVTDLYAKSPEGFIAIYLIFYFITDVWLIFHPEHRCLHDFACHTQVVYLPGNERRPSVRIPLKDRLFHRMMGTRL